jgi:murein DD-endopeptidase MepM/ murein hydrolase activator NlpD
MADIQQRDDNIYRVIFESEPISSSIRKAGFGGVNKYANLENLENAELVIKTATHLDRLAKEAYIQSKSYDEVMRLALNKEKMLAAIPAIQPVSNKDLKRTASGWGYRIHPIYKIRKFHYGMDFTAPTGTEIYATGDGVVATVKGNKRSKIGFGLEIIIDHGFGYETLYAHLNEFNVKAGQKVKRGDVIGYVGNTGGSTAPHLHYEIHKNGKPVNPEYFYFKDLTPQEYEKMVAISSNMGQSFD